MGNNKKKSKASSNGHRPRNGSRPNNSHVGTNHVATAALGRRVERSSTGSPNQNLRTYEIPDFRMEHPEFSVRQLTEKDKTGQEHVRHMSRSLERVLADHLQISKNIGPDNFVFCRSDEDPRPHDPDDLRREVLYPVLDRCGIQTHTARGRIPCVPPRDGQVLT